MFTKLLKYKDNQALKDYLVDLEIDSRIKSGLYPPKDEWSSGSYDMIKTCILSTIDHKFNQILTLQEGIEKYENHSRKN